MLSGVSLDVSGAAECYSVCCVYREEEKVG
jgi:hypothetical protein